VGRISKKSLCFKFLDDTLIYYHCLRVFPEDMIALREPQGYGSLFSGINSARALAATTLQSKAGGGLPGWESVKAAFPRETMLLP
jgi:hypothetical protein